MTERAAATDATALVPFAIVGLLSHSHGISAAGLARDALPILGGWFAGRLLLRLAETAPRRRGGTSG